MQDFTTAMRKSGRPMGLLAILVAWIAAGAAGCYSARTPVPSSAVLRGDGIVLEEGENISGVYQWHGGIPMSIAYTYTFRPPGSQSPGLLEMEFELINGEVYDALTVDVVIADENRRIIGGGRLFERKGRVYITGPHAALKLDPYSAHSFAFAGGGFFNRDRSDDVPRPRPFGMRSLTWM
jgi:hypothetical protein